jgi:glycosyltransferase involved in cell wall biosynthesis
LGYVGRLSFEKGPDIFIEALSRLTDRVGSIRTLVAGAGPLDGQVQRLVDERGVKRVEFLGWVDDPGPVLATVDVLVLPSRAEAVPLVLAEALAAGCLVVAADAGGGVRDVLGGGALGRIVKTEDPAALASAIEAAISDVRDGRVPDRAMVESLLAAHEPIRVFEAWVRLLTIEAGRLPRE